jgi:hypothetical protein
MVFFMSAMKTTSDSTQTSEKKVIKATPRSTPIFVSVDIVNGPQLAWDGKSGTRLFRPPPMSFSASQARSSVSACEVLRKEVYPESPVKSMKDVTLLQFQILRRSRHILSRGACRVSRTPDEEIDWRGLMVDNSMEGALSPPCGGHAASRRSAECAESWVISDTSAPVPS